MYYVSTLNSKAEAKNNPDHFSYFCTYFFHFFSGMFHHNLKEQKQQTFAIRLNVNNNKI